mmetsp:Transcript_67551/g.187294  ORF Transcript_67551/g.187294 Transcript_67551/m.187294 type:complete len:221 (+) Transcript_67551:50-712(+)
MQLCPEQMAASIFFASLLASADGLRGWRWEDTAQQQRGEGLFGAAGGGDSLAGASGGGDYMDQYIAEAKGSQPATDVWWSAAAGSSDAQGRNSAAPDRHPAEHNWPGAAQPVLAVGSQAEEGAGALRAAASRGGAVVDVKLDSELQLSNTDGRSQAGKAQPGRNGAAAFTQADARSAPDVDEAVAEERMEDVYIHDDFGAAAAADASEEQSLRDSRDLRA